MHVYLSEKESKATTVEYIHSGYLGIEQSGNFSSVEMLVIMQFMLVTIADNVPDLFRFRAIVLVETKKGTEDSS